LLLRGVGHALDAISKADAANVAMVIAAGLKLIVVPVDSNWMRRSVANGPRTRASHTSRARAGRSRQRQSKWAGSTRRCTRTALVTAPFLFGTIAAFSALAQAAVSEYRVHDEAAARPSDRRTNDHQDRPMTTIENLLERKQKLLERLQANPDTHERDEIEGQLAQIDTALDMLEEPGESSDEQ
jgi:hypothetical protein